MNSESRLSRKQAGAPGPDKIEARPDSTPAAAFRGIDNSLTHTLSSACKWLMEQQKPDGHWVGSVASNASMEAEWCLALWFLGLEDHPLRPRLGKALLEMQREDGSWGIYYGAGNGDINATVESYAALRSLGYAADDPALSRAATWIASKGGLRNVRVFTRYWLALIGEWPWEKTPNLPPEIIWFPNKFVFSIYNFAQWARATLVPLAILSARRSSRPLRPQDRLDALFPGGRENFDYELPPRDGQDLWATFFRKTDRALHWLQTKFLKRNTMREAAIRHMLEWIIRHQDADGGWGGIQPPWVYGLMALHGEDYQFHHPVMAKGLAALDDPGWRYDRGDASWVQATNSPVWDTMLALMALHDADAETDFTPEMDKALGWLLERQVRVKGDWSVKLPDLEPGGWAFEYANDRYPDTDDTAVALIALAACRDREEWKGRGVEAAITRGVNWLVGMQSTCGGWGAFDKDNNRALLSKIPFCDFGEALDPPSVDVTAHVLEAFGVLGLPRDMPALQRGLAYIRAEQEADGPWFGRWGVNYLYGTGAVLPALAAIGEDMTQPYIARACDWLVAHQQENGGWGESCASYMEIASIGRGPTTPSQTAWALMGLIAANRKQDHEAIVRGCRYLIDQQQADGSWEEKEFTGTGFPGYGVGQTIKLDDPALTSRLQQGAELSRAFMLRYDLYRQFFPIMALSRAVRVLKGSK
ncbi:squalene--hopene cyclase [Komagataeibacter nataicola]|uniref:Squalene--hopene cyclase n=2 Tax=Komagataeibacter nataicola TaxID=265960 RepID=A0A9N7H375_9PROT|nr:squalene--hopene cyclase [Komagataeibacter nataicola]AQU88860.1 squalene--hopene cyclase [Komagataeibacter nataicola]PYD66851.1 squalene--hopene cyclase [Komagataeibacter nataicola]WEQ56380.1 squalene--hopene cyclase [Komagataeibacter nataicola]